jgi:adenylate kinase family enzyme
MARFPRTITLVEAFRRILRGMGQPALADKIPTRSGWELPYPEDDITRSKRVRKLIRAKQETAKKEMAKLKEARELFGD